jgi:molybdenum cofactor synthesis domain-containing protein
MQMNNPKAVIVIIGNEILSGRTQDINIKFLTFNLGEIGVIIGEVRVISDDKQIIIRHILELSKQYDYVFTTGGIGPTHDDITSESIAEALGLKYELNAKAHQLLLDYYGAEKLNDARLRMAKMPEGAILINNPVSVAPGYIINNIYVLAGVPNIMQAMFASIKSSLKTGVKISSYSVTSFVLEGQIAGVLGKIQNNYNDLEIGSYPFFRDDKHGTSLVIRGYEKNLILKAANEIEAEIIKLGEDFNSKWDD